MHVKENIPGTCFHIGYEILANKGAALVGISPGNSYFKAEAIYHLLSATSSLFSKVIIIMIPDRPYEYTFQARGYSLEKAQKTARLQGNNLKNNCARAIQKLGLSPSQFHIIDWKQEVDTNPLVQTCNTYIQNLYSSNKLFKEDIRIATRPVVQHQTYYTEAEIEAALDIGVNYLLDEFGFLKAAPEMYQVGKLAYIYHRRWPIFEDLINGKYGQHLQNIGFVVIEEDGPQAT